jgi:hypothetical protein
VPPSLGVMKLLRLVATKIWEVGLLERCSCLCHGLKENYQSRSGGRRVFPQCRCRRPDAAAFQPCHDTLRGVHPQRLFRLRQAGAGPGLDEICCQRKLLVQRLIFFAVFRVGKPFFMQFADFGHLRAFARWRTGDEAVEACGDEDWGGRHGAVDFPLGALVAYHCG